MSIERRHFLSLLVGGATVRPGWGRSAPAAGARRRAIAYLARCQSEDGAWRSKVYGAFQDGGALTPLATRALVGRHEKACARGLAWLRTHREEALGPFPVHNASLLLELASQDARIGEWSGSLVERLRSLQLGSALGWSASEPSFGGWSYVGVAPRFREGLQLAPMQQSNLSPTIFALAGLRAAGVPVEDPAVREAGAFVRSCQNYRAEHPGTYDDGGFYQMNEDRWRNKAGVAGKDEAGRERLRSYHAATADGLAGLLLSGAAPGDPRVQAAAGWLKRHPALDDVPHLQLYGSYARGRARRLAPGLLPPSPGAAWPEGVSLEPESDGSFLNPAGELRENDPVVATALALMP